MVDVPYPCNYIWVIHPIKHPSSPSHRLLGPPLSRYIICCYKIYCTLVFFSTVTPSNPNDYGWWYPPKNPNLCPTLLLGEFSCPTWVCLKIVYPYTQWFCWSLSLLNGHNWGYTPFLDISTNEESNQWPLCITGTSLKPWNEKAAGWSERRWRFLRTMPRCASKAWGNMCHSGGKRLVSVGKHTSGNEGFISWIYI
jgi:hypothetical protein